MAFNFYQLFILFGLLQGIICVIILLSSTSLRSKSNLFLGSLMIAFIANVGLYWLRDVNLISNNVMQLCFLPWQMMVPPLFLLYVWSLKIFDFITIPKWTLFIPVIIALVFHLIVKADLVNTGLGQWESQEWVSYFYLAEEIVSILYSLIASAIIYLSIQKEKKSNNYLGFGLNKSIARWIRTMIQMGLVLAAIWIFSLYRFSVLETQLNNYYFLWMMMVVVLNILGIVGIYNSLKSGGFKNININQGDMDNVSPKRTELIVSTPYKYYQSDRLDSILKLNTDMAVISDQSYLQTAVTDFLKKEFNAFSIDFDNKESKDFSLISDNSKIQIPYQGQDGHKETFAIDFNNRDKISEEDLYHLEVLGKSLSFQMKRLSSNGKVSKITEDHKLYQELISQMKEKEWYSNPAIDLQSLADRLNISSGYLSKMIHDVTNKNFNDFINDYRVQKVKQLMKDPSYSHYTVLGYGLEAGFNSKSTFYSAFQKVENLSPGRYLEKIKTNS